MVREAVEAKENQQLQRDKDEKAKLDEYKAFHTSKSMPRYLRQRRSWWLNYGRSVKTQLRCGTSELEVEMGRHARPIVPRENRTCKCCATGQVEDSFHFVMRCPHVDEQRQQMEREIERAIRRGGKDCFGWRKMSERERWMFILGDGPEVSSSRANKQWGTVETHVYNFLAAAYKARQAYLKEMGRA